MPRRIIETTSKPPRWWIERGPMVHMATSVTILAQASSFAGPFIIDDIHVYRTSFHFPENDSASADVARRISCRYCGDP